MINKAIVKKLVDKAEQTTTCYRISAIAFNKKGEILGSATNSFKMDGRIAGKGSGIHAERRLISRYKNNIHTIIICRIGLGGDILPIDPCEVCKKVASKMGIKIISVKDE